MIARDIIAKVNWFYWCLKNSQFREFWQTPKYRLTGLYSTFYMISEMHVFKLSLSKMCVVMDVLAAHLNSFSTLVKNTQWFHADRGPQPLNLCKCESCFWPRQQSFNICQLETTGYFLTRVHAGPTFVSKTPLDLLFIRDRGIPTLKSVTP